MTYVRHLPEVGEPLLKQVGALDDLVEEQRKIAERFNALAEELRADVFQLWSPAERRTAQYIAQHGRLPDVI